MIVVMPALSQTHPVAFFCAEYGIKADLPLYAGGLGVLAGDILKQAADDHLPMVGIGLLYRGEGARQVITPEGCQVEANFEFDPVSAGLEHVYVDEMPLFIKVHLTQLEIWVRCWKLQLGSSVTLYLLDTDTDQNHPAERDIAASVYTGTEEALLKQQLILGIGGVKLLHALNIHPALYHLNEGRPAFMHWQLIRSYMDEHGISYDQARQLAKSKTVYTNHTLVGGGHQSVSVDLLKAYSQYYAEKMGISVDELLQPGRKDGHFDLTSFALNISTRVSAVSTPHFELCRQGWPEYDWVNVTNGVHFPTWQASDVPAVAGQPNLLWQVHQAQKQQLSQFVHEQTGFSFDPQRMVISWARRITGYKQLDSLFADVARFKALASVKNREIQLLVAGKAHAYDTYSKDLLQQVIRYFQNELAGHALFIPNYNLDVARALVQGSDLWLNTPEWGLEASGTSGMKAISNGVLQCTVADGWAAEVDWQGVGWTLDPEAPSGSLYQLLEDEIVPQFWDREAGVPQAWVARMQRSIQVAQRYSAKRMVLEYQEKLYSIP